MSAVNAYSDATTFKAWADAAGGGGFAPGDDALADLALTAASRRIDHYCGRHFWLEPSATVRLFDFDRCSGRVNLDDIGDLTGLAVAVGDGVSWTVQNGSTYDVEPLNPTRNGEAWPYDTLRWYFGTGFPYVPIPGRKAYVQVTARWGWPAVPASVQQACLILATRMYKRRDAWNGVAGFDAQGAVVRLSPMDPDVGALLAPYAGLGVA
jgi:hypothetical protein